ncbi:MAG: hypothetical protein KBE91_06990 [Bacteroidia bacterium]|nr:hypothetical protein [Bacteroidia bacterium]
MKALIALILFLNLSVIDSNWIAYKAPKKATKVALLLKNQPLDSCKSIVIKHMQSNNYIIATNEKTAFHFLSKPKTIGITEIKLEVTGTKTDSGYFVIFKPSGLIKTNTAIGNGNLEVYNSGLKGSLAQNAWDDLNAMCKKISPKLYYQTGK